MEWIKEANTLLRKQQEREALISEHEVPMFTALCDEIRRHVEAAKETFPTLEMNGRPDARRITLPPTEPQTIPWPASYVIVALSREKHQVQASGEHVTETFDLDVKRDGTVCLKRQGVELPDSEIAIYILRPFLYPELPPYGAQKLTPRVAVGSGLLSLPEIRPS
jgi:hypothetical protein